MMMNEKRNSKNQVKKVHFQLDDSLLPQKSEDALSTRLKDLTMMTFQSLKDHVMSFRKFELKIDWLDAALQGGFSAGYLLNIVGERERDVLRMSFHVLLQCWKNFPSARVLVIDANRHFRPEFMEKMLKKYDLHPHVNWEEQLLLFHPTSYLEVLLLLDAVDRDQLQWKDENGTLLERWIPQLIVAHQLPVQVSLDAGEQRVDHVFHLLASLAFRKGIHVVSTNVLDLLDLADDDKITWYWETRDTNREFLKNDVLKDGDDGISKRTSFNEIHSRAKINEQYDRHQEEELTLLLPQVASGAMERRIPYHLFLVKNENSTTCLGILKEQNITIATGLIDLNFF